MARKKHVVNSTTALSLLEKVVELTKLHEPERVQANGSVVLTPIELSGILGCSTTAIHNMVKNGRIVPFMKMKGVTRFLDRDIRQLIESNN